MSDNGEFSQLKGVDSPRFPSFQLNLLFLMLFAQGRLTFIVKEETLHWSEVFSKIQALQREHKHFVTDITVNETSLEDIFLQFANTSYSKQQQQASSEPNNAIETLAV